MTSSILQLCDLISTSASTLVRTCTDNHLPLPHLDDELSPISGAFRQNPTAAEAANIISAAALQLVAILLPPQQSIINLMGGVRCISLVFDYSPGVLLTFCPHSISKLLPCVFVWNATLPKSCAKRVLK